MFVEGVTCGVTGALAIFAAGATGILDEAAVGAGEAVLVAEMATRHRPQVTSLCLVRVMQLWRTTKSSVQVNMIFRWCPLGRQRISDI